MCGTFFGKHGETRRMFCPFFSCLETPWINREMIWSYFLDFLYERVVESKGHDTFCVAYELLLNALREEICFVDIFIRGLDKSTDQTSTDQTTSREDTFWYWRFLFHLAEELAEFILASIKVSEPNQGVLRPGVRDTIAIVKGMIKHVHSDLNISDKDMQSTWRLKLKDLIEGISKFDQG